MKDFVVFSFLVVILAAAAVQGRSRMFGNDGSSQWGGDGSSTPAPSNKQKRQQNNPDTLTTNQGSMDNFFGGEADSPADSRPATPKQPHKRQSPAAVDQVDPSSPSSSDSVQPESTPSKSSTNQGGKKGTKKGNNSNQDSDGGDTSSPGTGTDNSNPSGADGKAPKDTSGAGSEEALSLHNSYRARHGAPALSWSTSIASSAQSYANGCVFEHSGSSGVGENLAQGYGSWSAAIAAWYNENSSYNYNGGDFSESTGHFTQMVWKGSRQLGCGQASCSGGTLYVCQYSPAGNVIGEFGSNVSPPSAS